MKHKNILETVTRCQEIIDDPTPGALIIITDLLITQYILLDLLENITGERHLSQGEFEFISENKGRSESKVDVLGLWSSKEIFDYVDQTKKSHKPLIMILACCDVENMPQDVECIVCHNERALSTLKLAEQLEEMKDDDAIVVYRKNGAFFAEKSTNGKLFLSNAFNSVMLCASPFGPAVTSKEYVNFLRELPTDMTIELTDNIFPSKEKFTFFSNVVSIKCISRKDAVDYYLRILKKNR